MAHLAHKLPWNALASRLDSVRDRKDLTPRYTDLFFKPGSEEQLRHFLEAFGDVIREFATTERKKYKANIIMPDHKGSLFPPSLWESALPYMKDPDVFHPKFGSMNLHDAERIENWIANVGQDQMSYDNPWNGPVAFLLAEGHMEPLLKIAKHPEIYLDKLRGGNYKDHFTMMITNALRAYFCLNLIFCKAELWSEGRKDHLTMRSFQGMLRQLQDDYGGDLVHLHARKYVGWPKRDDFDPFLDLNNMRDYLKECFQLFVRYELMEREAGRAPDWKEIFVWWTPFNNELHLTSLCEVGRLYRKTFKEVT